MTIDQSSGLLSRESILQELDKALQQASSEGKSVAVAAFDIDRFRSLGVEHGTEFSERLVRSVGEVLTRTFGKESRIGRHTTDEFMVVSSGASASQAAERAEAARREVESLAIQPQQDAESSYPVQPTVSAGVAFYPTDASVRAELLHKAAEALQRAKQTGKNQVCLAADTEVVPKTIRIPRAQVTKLAELSSRTGRPETILLREALDDLFCKYQNGRFDTHLA